MNKNVLPVILLIALVVGGIFYFKKDDAAPIRINGADEVAYYDFENAPITVLSNVQATVRKDNETDRIIGPDEYIKEVRLLSYEKMTWDNNCLVDAPAPGTNCAAGTYSGYVVRLNIDGDLQEWRFTEDGELGSISGGLTPEFP